MGFLSLIDVILAQFLTSSEDPLQQTVFAASLDLDPIACGAVTMSTKDSADSSAKRHRACDECRQRKLACSKDPGGCDRCRRENIACHYSEQKPMGRPRKRQFVEVVADEPASNPKEAHEQLPMLPDDFDVYNDGFAESYLTTMHQPTGPTEVVPEIRSLEDNGRVVWHFGGHEILSGPPINYGDIDFGSGGNSIPSLEPLPQLSTISNPSVTDSESSPPQSMAGPCSCLASMYLSLASLQQFPSDIVAALKIVRGAAATAAQSLWCPQCGSVLLDTPTPPIESFQNTMLLGTIIPIIANGYGRLLKMIDEETDQAIAAGQTKMFRFHDYGGLCGRQTTTVQQAMTCVEKDLFFNAVEMPPAQWRTTVRALLRVDIYGHEQPAFKHKGLKDLVSEMEYRQRTRHELIDAQVAAGNLSITESAHGWFQKDAECTEKLHHGEQTRGCYEILKMAKIAIDSLVIA